jgi:branched-chain amino acid transport system permease protein
MGDRPRPKAHVWRDRQRRFREAAGAFRRPIRGVVGTLTSPVRDVVGKMRAWIEPRRRWAVPSLAVLGIAVMVVLPLVDGWLPLPGWLRLATSSSALARFALFALFAMGLNVVVGFAGLLDLGYVAFWAIGAYTAGLLSGAATYTRDIRTAVGTVERPEWAMWMWLIFLVAIAVAVVAGIVLGSPTLRLRGDYLAIVTLGFGEIIRVSARNLDSITLGPRGIASIPHPAIEVGDLRLEWGSFLDPKYYWLSLFFVVVWIIAISLLDRSRIGRAWVAIREDEVAAAAMGVPVVRMKLTAFVIGASTAGVGGVIYAQTINSIAPDTFSVIQSILILCMVVIGGMGSLVGSLLGAAIIVLVPEIFRGFDEYRFLAFGVALVVVMIFRPQGLLPSKRRKAELKGAVVEEQVYDASLEGGGGLRA